MFERKVWTDRVAANLSRRRLTNTETGEQMLVDVTREEGEVITEGDAFSAANMNDLEGRIARGVVSSINGKTPEGTDGSVTLTSEDIHPVIEGAGSHNAIYRGKNLGSSVTTEQFAAIAAGTFDDMYIGDYWVINGVNWRIAAFDYYYRTGDIDCTTHHVVIVPDTVLYTAQMNTSDVTTGAYIGSAMYTRNLANAKTAINNAFGSGHILSHRQYLQNAVTNGYASAGSWYDSTVELMTEQNVYGCKVHGDCINGTIFPDSYTVDKSQFPLFALDPTKVNIRNSYWLRDVASSESFCQVYATGDASIDSASVSYGVRPAFSIKS